MTDNMDNTLNHLLKDWTERHTLSVSRAEAIRLTVTAGSAVPSPLPSVAVSINPLPLIWWQDFSNTLRGVLHQTVCFPLPPVTVP